MAWCSEQLERLEKELDSSKKEVESLKKKIRDLQNNRDKYMQMGRHIYKKVKELENTIIPEEVSSTCEPHKIKLLEIDKFSHANEPLEIGKFSHVNEPVLYTELGICPICKDTKTNVDFSTLTLICCYCGQKFINENF